MNYIINHPVSLSSEAINDALTLASLVTCFGNYSAWERAVKKLDLPEEIEDHLLTLYVHNTLLTQLLEEKCVIVLLSMRTKFIEYCNLQGVRPCGGALVDGWDAQYFYLD